MNRIKQAFLALATCVVGPFAADAVSPLVTDDADTTPPGQIQVNSDFTLSRRGPTTLYSIPINPVVGLFPSFELAATFGYQWRDGPGAAANRGNAAGITDLTIAPKIRLGEAFDDKLRFGARIDLKLPSALDRNGLGTGRTDAGLVAIATYTIGNTALDFNLGYYAINLGRCNLDDDHWFVGQAIRQKLGHNWNLLTEAYLVAPNTARGGQVALYFSGGPVWIPKKSLSITGLIGTAAGHQSPDLTATLEVACQF